MSRSILLCSLFVIATGLLLAGHATTASAGVIQIVNIDFNGKRSGDTPIDFTGTGPGGGGDWNHLEVEQTSSNTLPSGPIVDNAGNNTAITLAASNFNGADTVNGSGFTGNGLLGDYLINDKNSTATLTLENLTPGQVYELYLFGNHGFGSGVEFTINSASQSTTGGTSGATPFVLERDYVVFESLQPNGSNELVISLTNSTTQVFNGLQLVAVPEPASAALLVGGLTLIVARRRTR